MRGIKSAFAVLCLSAVCASAYSQEYAVESSYNSIGYYAGYGVNVSASGYTVYPLAGNYQKGNAAAGAGVYGVYGVYSYAANEAFAGPGYGFASIGYGFEQYLTFTNNNPTGATEAFGVSSLLIEQISTSARGYAIDFGGIQEFGGAYFLGFNTIIQDGLGAPYDLAYNWDVVYNYTSPGYTFTISEGGFTDYLAAGQSITVGIWASGITQATSPAAVPAPAAIAPFALGLLGALRRRNKKS